MPLNMDLVEPFRLCQHPSGAYLRQHWGTATPSTPTRRGSLNPAVNMPPAHHRRYCGVTVPRGELFQGYYFPVDLQYHLFTAYL